MLFWQMVEKDILCWVSGAYQLTHHCNRQREIAKYPTIPKRNLRGRTKIVSGAGNIPN